jgi:hypothetical protein
MDKLNRRPRKALGYRTPNEAFFEDKPTVALRGRIHPLLGLRRHPDWDSGGLGRLRRGKGVVLFAPVGGAGWDPCVLPCAILPPPVQTRLLGCDPIQPSLTPREECSTLNHEPIRRSTDSQAPRAQLAMHFVLFTGLNYKPWSRRWGMDPPFTVEAQAYAVDAVEKQETEPAPKRPFFAYAVATQ